jgi:hypothetical protein
MTSIKKGISYGSPDDEMRNYYNGVEERMRSSKHCQSQFIEGSDRAETFENDFEIIDHKTASRHQSYLNKISNCASPKQYNKFGFSNNGDTPEINEKSPLKSRRSKYFI